MSAPPWLGPEEAARLAEIAPAMHAAARRLPRDWPKEHRPASAAGWSDHQQEGELDDV